MFRLCFRRLAVRNRAALAEIATELKIAGTTDLQPEWLSYIYQRSPVMSAVVRGRDHVFVSANDAFRRGAGSGEILGRPFIDVFPDNAHGLPRDLPPVEVALMRALGGEPVHDLRIRMFLPALGRDASVRIDAEPLVVAEGVVRGVIAAITEVVQDPLMA